MKTELEKSLVEMLTTAEKFGKITTDTITFWTDLQHGSVMISVRRYEKLPVYALWCKNWTIEEMMQDKPRKCIECHFPSVEMAMKWASELK